MQSEGEHIHDGTRADHTALMAALDLNNRLLADLVQVQRFALLGPEKIVEVVFENDRILFHVPYGDVDYIQKKLVANRSFYELNNLVGARKVMGEGAVIADIGANIGNHSLFFAVCCRAAHVYAFEPVRTNFDILARNVELNRLQNVTLFNRPVGVAGEGAAIASYKLRNTGATIIERDNASTLKYMSLDDVAFSRLDFVKIDVEGQQKDVIRGSERTLRKFRPKVMIEIRDNELASTNALLRDLGMRERGRIGGFDYLFDFD
jgi:FkbM family methyltransferase